MIILNEKCAWLEARCGAVHRAAIRKGNARRRGQGQTVVSEKFSFESRPMKRTGVPAMKNLRRERVDSGSKYDGPRRAAPRRYDSIAFVTRL